MRGGGKGGAKELASEYEEEVVAKGGGKRCGAYDDETTRERSSLEKIADGVLCAVSLLIGRENSWARAYSMGVWSAVRAREVVEGGVCGLR